MQTGDIQFVYEPRQQAWNYIAIIEQSDTYSPALMLGLIQEALYCMEGVETPIVGPSNSEEQTLMIATFSKVFNAFANFAY